MPPAPVGGSQSSCIQTTLEPGHVDYAGLCSQLSLPSVGAGLSSLTARFDHQDASQQGLCDIKSVQAAQARIPEILRQ